MICEGVMGEGLPAVKGQRLTEARDIQLSAYRLIRASETGGSCPNDEIGVAAGMSESGGQRKSAVSKPVGRG
jgi:hypothetical protein